MAKRELDKERHYKSIINKQKKIIQELKKKAGRGTKSKELFDDLQEELIEQLESEDEKGESSAVCPECRKGELEVVDLKIRKMIVCNKCTYRKVNK